MTPCDRETFIFEQIRGRKVLHLGCADWPFTEHKVRRKSLLHQRMMQHAGTLVGVDLEPRGIELMQAAGISNVHVGNLELDLEKSVGSGFDVIVAGEIIEHVLNAGQFLASIRRIASSESRLVLTTPNSAPIKRLPRLLYRVEQVHPDHVCYFSRSTLSRLLQMCGWEDLEWRTYWRDVGTVSRLSNLALRRIPFLQYYADGFCVVCRVASQP